MARKVMLFSVLFVAVVFALYLLVVIAPTQDIVSGTNTVSDAVETVEDAVDSVNEAIENSPVGEAIEKMDNARSQ